MIQPSNDYLYGETASMNVSEMKMTAHHYHLHVTVAKSLIKVREENCQLTYSADLMKIP